MYRTEQQQRVRKRDVHQEPAVQNLVQAALLVQLPFFFANVFEVVQI